jgi:hypothetical protein
MAALHAFRIRGKELRYSMELLAAAFPLRFREKLYPIIETLQDKLGEINDLVPAQMRLQQRIQMADDVAQVDRLKTLLAEENARLERSRRAFFQWFTPQFRVGLCAQFKEIFGGLQEPTRAAAIEGLPRPPSKRLCKRAPQRLECWADFVSSGMQKAAMGPGNESGLRPNPPL